MTRLKYLNLKKISIFRKARFPKRSERNGFTMIELLLVVSLVSIVGFGIYSLFDSGIRVAETATQSLREEDLNIFTERLANDLQNSFPFEGIPFQGDSEQMSFAARMMNEEEQGDWQGIGQVCYAYLSGKRAVERSEKNVSAFYKEKKGRERIVLEKVDSFQISYFAYDRTENKYLWLEKWEAGEKKEVPIAVKMSLKYEEEGEKRSLVRTFSIPVLGEKG